MREKLGETIKSRCPQKQSSSLPVAAVVDKNNKDKIIHEVLENIDKLRNELGLLKSDVWKMQALSQKQDQQHESEKLSARLCQLTATLSAVQKRNANYQHETEELNQKLDHQEQCAMVAKQQIATLQGQVLALTALLEHGKDALQKACDHIAALAAEKENRDKLICDLISALPPAVRESSHPLLAAVYDDLPPLCSMFYVRIPVSTA
jgi:DNA repair exonuclease SbcCD ATPase subunit